MLLVVVSHRQVQYKASNLSLKICHFHRIFAPFVMTVALFDRKLHLIWIILNAVPNIKRQYWRFERKNSKLCACHLTDFLAKTNKFPESGNTPPLVYYYNWWSLKYRVWHRVFVPYGLQIGWVKCDKWPLTKKMGSLVWFVCGFQFGQSLQVAVMWQYKRVFSWYFQIND